MVTFTLKNIPNTLHRQLKKQAQLHHRSLNSEMLSCLEKTTGSVVVDVDSVLKHARALRKQVSERLTNQTLRSFKNKGRP